MKKLKPLNNNLKRSEICVYINYFCAVCFVSLQLYRLVGSDLIIVKIYMVFKLSGWSSSGKTKN